jgi:hypothetical protein
MNTNTDAITHRTTKVRPPAIRSASRALMPTVKSLAAVARREVEANFEVENKVDQRNNGDRYKPPVTGSGMLKFRKNHALRG